MELDSRLEAAASCWGLGCVLLFIGSLGTLEDGNLWRPRRGVYFFVTALVSCCEWQKPAKLRVTTRAQRICRNARVAYLMGKWFPQ